MRRKNCAGIFIPCSIGYPFLKALRFCPSSFQPTSYTKQFQISKNAKRADPAFSLMQSRLRILIRYFLARVYCCTAISEHCFFLFPDQNIVESYPLLKSGSGRSFNGCKIRSAIFTRTYPAIKKNAGIL